MTTTLRKISDPLYAVLRRAAFGLLVLAVIAYLSYFGLDMARGTPFAEAVGNAVQETLAYGGRLLEGDLGMTAAGSLTLRPRPISEVLTTTVINSLGLLFAALLIAAPIGVVLGIWASRRRHSNWPLLTLVASIIGVSVPSFFAALLLQLGVIQLTRLTGRTVLPAGGFGWDKHLLLPALVLAARPLAQIARVTFVTLNEVLDQDYIRTAYSKGLTTRAVINRHVIRNAAVAILTTIGVSLRFALSSLPVVEFFFAWPGLGFTLLKSISQRDDNLTVVLLLSLGILFIAVNLFLEIAYRLIDPRLRDRSGSRDESEHRSLLEVLRAAFSDFRSWLSDNPLQRWRSRTRNHPEPSPFKGVLEERGEADRLEPFRDGRAGELRAWFQGTLGNFPLVVGGLLVFALAAVILFGPQLAPHSPYTTQGLTFENGVFRVPPFEPDAVYPLGTDVLGRDILSLILAGAQQTLFLTLLVVLVRLVVGFVLGSVSGWFSGGTLDRLLVGAAEVISAFPALLLAMTLILALGIREGLRPFIIALSFVGWGETMQFVRGEVMSIRPKLFIEGATAVGVRTPRIIARHILPNLIPALISIAALEMGAVLMLLGELGFIGIFIGGGAFAELDVAGAPYHYSDAPEWGALLSNVREYARAYPWTAIYPSLAFFIAILGFNLFGEGIRRMVQVVGVGLTRLFNRYTFAAVALAGFGFVYVRGQTGALAYYQEQAAAFDGQQAMEYLAELTSPEFRGRSLGGEGVERTAQYIAGNFKGFGIQPAGENFTYFQNRQRSYERLLAPPSFSIADGGPDLEYRKDFSEFPAPIYNWGEADGEVVFISFRDLTLAGGYGVDFPALRGRDYRGKVLMLLSGDMLHALTPVPRDGVLVVADEDRDLQRRYTLSNSVPWSWYAASSGGGRYEKDAPFIWISKETANRILQPTGFTVDDLRRQEERLERDEVYEMQVPTQVAMDVQGEVVQKAPAMHVVGHMPGVSMELDDRLIVVMAQYDEPPTTPEGGDYSGAVDNASGLAVMLETIRTMQETGYQPAKTMLFVAYSGEGLEGGEQFVPEVSQFLKTKYGFENAFDIEAVIELRGLGAGGDKMVLLTGGSRRLADLFQSAARRMGVPVERAGERVDMSVVFGIRSAYPGGDEAPGIGLTWDGWEEVANTPNDVYDQVNIDNLDAAGKVLNLGLMILGRETQY